jgi:hypothetical protein
MLVMSWLTVWLPVHQSGQREVGETAVIGYFQQHPPEVEAGLRLIDYIK